MAQLTAEIVRRARRHLAARDPVMRRMMRDVGAFKLHRQRDRFGMLVRSIISQQISVRAAATIRRRLIELVGPPGLTPETIVAAGISRLQSVGVSGRKASYIIDLATRVERGELQLTSIGRLSDDRIIERLTIVRGIGVWTAQMFLIFSLGRPDVFPSGDLGIRTAIRNEYDLPELPTPTASSEIACRWSPYATVASWYCWRTLDAANQPEND